MSVLDGLKENVERGASLLDEKFPGWEYEVDLDLMNTSSSSFCPGSQVAQKRGLYSYVSMSVFLNTSTRDCGFTVAPESSFLGRMDPTEVREGYTLLDGFWRDEIMARRNAKSVSAEGVNQVLYEVSVDHAAFVT